MKQTLNEWKKFLNESKTYYVIDPKNPPPIKEVIKKWQQNEEQAEEEEKQPDGRYYHARYSVDEIEPYLEYRWTREKGRNTPEEWDEIKKSIEENGLKSPLIINIGKEGGAKVGEGNHRFAIIKQIIKEKFPDQWHLAFTKPSIPVRFIFYSGKVTKDLY